MQAARERDFAQAVGQAAEAQAAKFGLFGMLAAFKCVVTRGVGPLGQTRASEIEFLRMYAALGCVSARGVGRRSSGAAFAGA